MLSISACISACICLYMPVFANFYWTQVFFSSTRWRLWGFWGFSHIKMIFNYIFDPTRCSCYIEGLYKILTLLRKSLTSQRLQGSTMTFQVTRTSNISNLIQSNSQKFSVHEILFDKNSKGEIARCKSCQHLRTRFGYQKVKNTPRPVPTNRVRGGDFQILVIQMVRVDNFRCIKLFLQGRGLRTVHGPEFTRLSPGAHLCTKLLKLSPTPTKLCYRKNNFTI